MDYADKFFAKIKDGTLEVDDMLEFMDKWLADESGRREREEKKRQAHKTCENCKYWTEDGCEYWGDFVDSEDMSICSQWR